MDVITINVLSSFDRYHVYVYPLSTSPSSRLHFYVGRCFIPEYFGVFLNSFLNLFKALCMAYCCRQVASFVVVDPLFHMTIYGIMI